MTFLQSIYSGPEDPAHPGKVSPDEKPLSLQKHFLEKRTIFLWEAVTDESMEKVIRQMLYLEDQQANEEIKIIINCPGGSVSAGWAMYDTMKMIQSPVATIAAGMAASMGAILLSSGTPGHRKVFPNARIMIHQPSLGGRIQGLAVDIETHSREIMATKRKMAETLAKNCGKPVDQVEKDWDRDYWMTAQEALDYGLVDGIYDKW